MSGSCPHSIAAKTSRASSSSFNQNRHPSLPLCPDVLPPSRAHPCPHGIRSRRSAQGLLAIFERKPDRAGADGHSTGVKCLLRAGHRRRRSPLSVTHSGTRRGRQETNTTVDGKQRGRSSKGPGAQQEASGPGAGGLFVGSARLTSPDARPSPPPSEKPAWPLLFPLRCGALQAPRRSVSLTEYEKPWTENSKSRPR